MDEKLSKSLEMVESVLFLLEKIQADPVIIGNFGYLHLIKTIVKKNADLEGVLEKLGKELMIKQKKIDKTEQLLSSFP